MYIGRTKNLESFFSRFGIPTDVQYRLVGEGVNNFTRQYVEEVLWEMEKNTR